jgi:hypothetical protein
LRLLEFVGEADESVLERLEEDEDVDVGSEGPELVDEYKRLELDCVVLALALAGAEEVVEAELDLLELESSEELELDCVTLALTEEEVSAEDSLVELESEGSEVET